MKDFWYSFWEGVSHLNPNCMRKIIITIIVALACIESQAQTEKGKRFIGGSVGFNSQSNQNNRDLKSNNFNISPSVGYFVAERFAIGLSAGYNASKDRYQTFDQQGNPLVAESKSNFLSISPFVQYFIPVSDGKFFFSPTLGTSLSFGRSRNSLTTNDTFSTSTYSVSVNPGFSYFPTEHWGINLNVGGLSYRVINPKGDNNNTSNLNFGLGSGASVGINYFF